MVITTGIDRTRPARAAGLLAVLGFLASSVAAQTPAPAVKPDVVKGTGLFPVVTQRSLVIRGIPGQIVVTTKPAREVHFTSRAKDKSGSERPIAVGVGDTTVTLSPPAGVTVQDGILRVEAPASFSVRVEARGGTVVVDGFAGAVTILGSGTVVRAQALTGPLDAGVEGGTLGLTNLGAAVAVRLGATSTLNATDLRAGLKINSQDATFKVQGVTGPCHVEARGGSGELAGFAGGGELRMSESALRLSGGRGELMVASDGTVEFSNMAASLRFEMEGGALRGKGNQGRVEVSARRTDVTLESVVGALRVTGEGVKAKLIGNTGELDLDVMRGTVVVQRATGSVTAVIFGGDAQFLELSGPIRLEIDGGNAEVAWMTLSGDKDSLLQNKNGDLTVRFPANSSCRVQAKVSSGRITSDTPAIKIPPEATEVQAALGQGQHPLVEIEADGNIHLSTGAKAPAPPS